MRAWVVERPGPIDSGPLALVERAEPEPRAGEVRIAVSVCGVCRTDLHLAEGDLAPHRPRVVPGHQVIGEVEAVGEGASRLSLGERVGVAWLGSTCGRCRFCCTGRENLCLSPELTGWDRDGGFADKIVADERFVYHLPAELGEEGVAPLLCAGIIGLRALRRSELVPGGRLGLYGFGASAHLVAQIALAEGATVHVVTRSPADQALARELGAASVSGSGEVPPEPLDAAILFAPAGELVLPALAALDRGGTLAVAGIHLSEIPPLDYARHLFEEKTLRSVTANTRSDGEELLALAARLALRARTTSYDFTDLPRALADLAHDRFGGAAVLRVGS